MTPIDGSGICRTESAWFRINKAGDFRNAADRHRGEVGALKFCCRRQGEEADLIALVRPSIRGMLIMGQPRH